jgi:hypothetical protein
VMQKSVIVFISIVCACAGTAITPELRRSAAVVRLIDGAPPAEFKLVSEVEGLSCARQLGINPDVTAAKEQLKVEAAKAKANAVASIVCAEEGTSFSDNCWKAIRCKGDAGHLP